MEIDSVSHKHSEALHDQSWRPLSIVIVTCMPPLEYPLTWRLVDGKEHKQKISEPQGWIWWVSIILNGYYSANVPICW